MQVENPVTYNEAAISERISKLKSNLACDFVQTKHGETIHALRRNAFSKPLKRIVFDSDSKCDGELSTTAGSDDCLSDSGFDTPTMSPNSKVKTFDLSPVQEAKHSSRPEFLFENTLNFIESLKAKATGIGRSRSKQWKKSTRGADLLHRSPKTFQTGAPRNPAGRGRRHPGQQDRSVQRTPL
eukprot:GABU01009306.1.p1 GENE.GABU01009306.1~~GABU01009306.1.p1  ORF type:complete len:183 (+),score=32.65 GABU01009306.1:15-563(+)